MAQLSKTERIDKLQQTFKVVEDDYLRILRGGSNGFNGDAMEIDEDDHEDEAHEVNGRPSKRVRIQ